MEQKKSQIKILEEQKYFKVVTGEILKDENDLINYLESCSDYSFNYHVNNSKNDFANWINYVWDLPSLSSKLYTVRNKILMREILQKHFEVTDYFIDNKSDFEKSDKIKSPNLVFTSSSPSITQPIAQPIAQVKVETPAVSSSNNVPVESSVSSDSKVSSQSSVSVSSNPGSFTVELKSNIEPEPEEKKQNESLFDPKSFHSFTDEELEHFVKFVKKEDAIEQDPRVDYLKVALKELQTMIHDLRIHGKDPLIADLMIRAVTPKIEFFKETRSDMDYNHIIDMLKEAQKEIIETDNMKVVNFADELLNDFRLQTIEVKNPVLVPKNDAGIIGMIKGVIQ